MQLQDQQALRGDPGLPPDKLPSSADIERLAKEIPPDVQFYYYRCYQADASRQEIISLRFAVVNIENPKTGKKRTTGVLLDDGSNMSLGSESLDTVSWIRRGSSIS